MSAIAASLGVKESPTPLMHTYLPAWPGGMDGFQPRMMTHHTLPRCSVFPFVSTHTHTHALAHWSVGRSLSLPQKGPHPLLSHSVRCDCHAKPDHTVVDGLLTAVWRQEATDTLTAVLCCPLSQTDRQTDSSHSAKLPLMSYPLDLPSSPGPPVSLTHTLARSLSHSLPNALACSMVGLSVCLSDRSMPVRHSSDAGMAGHETPQADRQAGRVKRLKTLICCLRLSHFISSTYNQG
uniref:Uncharacterized protein n=1 Tax=Vitrella brassicaformis TaxID=1169539 RepID=A0A7S1PCW6_9ALVE|mmetsp:Transcript_49155/g.123207  ORF Transcript_49155/g.123207 Transcript_49155/m.123207 type:complete len:236 (+) Transcript_49155:306-1013(+)